MRVVNIKDSFKKMSRGCRVWNIWEKVILNYFSFLFSFFDLILMQMPSSQISSPRKKLIIFIFCQERKNKISGRLMNNFSFSMMYFLCILLFLWVFLPFIIHLVFHLEFKFKNRVPQFSKIKSYSHQFKKLSVISTPTISNSESPLASFQKRSPKNIFNWTLTGGAFLMFLRRKTWLHEFSWRNSRDTKSGILKRFKFLIEVGVYNHLENSSKIFYAFKKEILQNFARCTCFSMKKK